MESGYIWIINSLFGANGMVFTAESIYLFRKLNLCNFVLNVFHFDMHCWEIWISTFPGYLFMESTDTNCLKIDYSVRLTENYFEDILRTIMIRILFYNNKTTFSNEKWLIQKE